MQSPYGYVQKFHVRSWTLAVFLALLFYYLVVAFHWEIVLASMESLGFTAASGILMLFTFTLKGGMFLSQINARDGSARKAANAVILISLYLVFALSSIGAAVWVASAMRRLIGTTYWTEAHWFWIASVLGVVFIFTGARIHRAELVSWRMLEDLKAIPIVSPIVCFSAPTVWSTNLAFATLPKSQIAVYSSLSIFAGVLFLIYWLAYAILNPKNRDALPTATQPRAWW